MLSSGFLRSIDVMDIAGFFWGVDTNFGVTEKLASINSLCEKT